MTPRLWLVFMTMIACGRASTPATAEVKSTAAQALSSMQAAAIAVSAAEAFVTRASGSLATGALDGIPAPPEVLYAVGGDALTVVYQRRVAPSTWFSGAVGCFRNSAQGATLVAPNGTTCTASQDLEIDFDNGDVLHFGGNAASGTAVTVTGGVWSGTSFVVTAQPARVVGRFTYQPPNGHALDVDVDWTSSGTASNQQYAVKASDHLANTSIESGWSMTGGGAPDSTVTASGHERFSVAVAGVAHSIEVDFQLVSSVRRDAASGTITAVSAVASGSVLWDQRQAGAIGNEGIHYMIDWNDGNAVPFGLPDVAPWL